MRIFIWGYDKIVETILKNGGDVNFQNKFGRTALLKGIQIKRKTEAPLLKLIMPWSGKPIN